MLEKASDRVNLALAPFAVMVAQVNITPDGSKAPGITGLRDAVNGLAAYALVAAAAGFLIGAICWSVGGRVGNDYTATGGKVGMVVAIGSMFLVGAAAAILNLAYNLGDGA